MDRRDTATDPDKTRTYRIDDQNTMREPYREEPGTVGNREPVYDRGERGVIRDDRTDRVDERGGRYGRGHDHATAPGDRNRFSFGATFLGWCVASFLTVVLVGLVLAAVGGAALADPATGFQDPETVTADNQQLMNLGIVGIIGTLLALFVAYLVGGYAAGRIGHWKGMAHGAVVPVWTIVIAIILGIVGATINLEGLVATPFAGVDMGTLTSAAVIGVILSLLAMFGGAILGGRMGESGDEKYLGYSTERRRTTRGRTV